VSQKIKGLKNLVITHAVSHQFPTAAARDRGNLGFVVEKTALVQVFSGYFDFPCHSFHRLIHTHHPSSGAGTVGQILADVPIGLILTLTQESLEICNIYNQSKRNISEVFLEHYFCVL
jgi:hypothetical protein